MNRFGSHPIYENPLRYDGSRLRASLEARRERVVFLFSILRSAAQEAPSGAAATIITDQSGGNDSGECAQKIRFYRSLEPVPFCDLCDFQMWIIFFIQESADFLGRSPVEKKILLQGENIHRFLSRKYSLQNR
jgi:hypothetical protein